MGYQLEGHEGLVAATADSQSCSRDFVGIAGFLEAIVFRLDSSLAHCRIYAKLHRRYRRGCSFRRSA